MNQKGFLKMNKPFVAIFSALLLLALVLSACGAQGKSGATSDSGATGKTIPVTLHSGGGCWSREGNATSHADLGRTSNPSSWQTGNSPWLGAIFFACQDVISLDYQPSSGSRYDFYQVRWSRPGLSEQQFSTTNQDSVDFTNARFRTTYSFKVQGCNNGFWGSDCTGWSPTVAVATYYPGDCYPGYVWREANANDHVCVTPATRDQTAYDNSQRNNRIDPSGAYGPDSCIQGYVWREAFSGDHVCVTPATRSQAAYDNAHVKSTTY